MRLMLTKFVRHEVIIKVNLFQYSTGSIAIVYDDDELKLGIVGWKGKMSIRAYVPRNDRLHFLRLIGADTAPFEVNKFKDQKDGDKAEEGPNDVDVVKDESGGEDAEVQDPADVQTEDVEMDG